MNPQSHKLGLQGPVTSGPQRSCTETAPSGLVGCLPGGRMWVPRKGLHRSGAAGSLWSFVHSFMPGLCLVWTGPPALALLMAVLTGDQVSVLLIC